MEKKKRKDQKREQTVEIKGRIQEKESHEGKEKKEGKVTEQSQLDR